MILSDRFLSDLAQYRICYMGGPFGSGKTLLATAITEHFFRKDYAIYCNYPNIFNSEITGALLQDGLSHAVVVFDEAGSRGFDARGFASKDQRNRLSVMDYARHLDLYFLFATATPVDKRARRLTVFRNLTASRVLGWTGVMSFFWLYSVIPAADETYSFPFFLPQAYYDLYSGMGNTIGQDGDALTVLLQDFQERYRFDAAQAERRAQQIKDHLRAGGVYPGILPESSPYLAGHGAGVPSGGHSDGSGDAS